MTHIINISEMKAEDWKIEQVIAFSTKDKKHLYVVVWPTRNKTEYLVRQPDSETTFSNFYHAIDYYNSCTS